MVASVEPGFHLRGPSENPGACAVRCAIRTAIRHVQALLGHISIGVTKVYLRLLPEQLGAGCEAAMPELLDRRPRRSGPLGTGT